MTLLEVVQAWKDGKEFDINYPTENNCMDIGKLTLIDLQRMLKLDMITIKEVPVTALCFSLIPGAGGVLHKHGDPSWVKDYYNEQREWYIHLDLKQDAAELFYLEGKFPPAELEKALTIADYTSTLYAKFLEGKLPEAKSNLTVEK